MNIGAIYTDTPKVYLLFWHKSTNTDTPKLSTYEHRRDLHVVHVAGGAADSARQLEDVGELPAGSTNRALIEP